MTVMTAVAAAVLTIAVPQQAPPRDSVRPGVLSPDGTAVEADLLKRIALAPADVERYLELARLQEFRGAPAEAERTLLRAQDAAPMNQAVVSALAAHYERTGAVDKTIAMMERAAEIDPANLQASYRVALRHFQRLRMDQALLPADKYVVITAGLAAVDRALRINRDYVDGLLLQGVLLQERAGLETDRVTKDQTLAAAASAHTRAMELGMRGGAAPTGTMLAARAPRAPRPLPPGPPPVRVGDTFKPPVKIKDVKAVYPPDAQAAGVSGVVILEVTIDMDGRVFNLEVLRSIPMLDDAAVQAVQQWEFIPSFLNGQPVPVIMTVTVNFTQR